MVIIIPQGCSHETAYIMASSTNINNDCIVELEKVRYLEKSVFDKENDRTDATPRDIFFMSVGSLGRSCVYEGGLNICFQRSVSIIHTLILKNIAKKESKSANPNGSYRAVRIFLRINLNKSIVPFIMFYRLLNKSALYTPFSSIFLKLFFTAATSS